VRGPPLALAALGVVLALAGCDGGVTEPPYLPEAGTPAWTPIPFLPSPGSLIVISPSSVDLLTANLDSFRGFARQVEAAIEERDIDFFAANALPSSVTCPSEPEPRCRGQPDGTVLEGIWVAPWRSEAELFTTQELNRSLGEYFAALPDARVTAIAAKVTKLVSLVGWPAFLAVVNSPSDASQDARVFDFFRAESGWRLKALFLVQGDIAQTDWLSGNCTPCYDYWERWKGAAP